MLTQNEVTALTPFSASAANKGKFKSGNQFTTQASLVQSNTPLAKNPNS